MRLRDLVRFWLWRAVGTRGHLLQCRTTEIPFVGRHGGAATVGYRCAPGCPAAARREQRTADALVDARGRYGRG